MKKHFLLSITFNLSFVFALLAQGPYYNQTPEFLNANRIWPIGGMAALNFRTSPPTVSLSLSIAGNNPHEGLAAASDPLSGKLRFYSDGVQVWDTNNQVMPHGDSLLGQGSGRLGSGFAGSALKGTCILPIPHEPEKYYLFSMNDGGNTSPDGRGGSPKGSLFYNVVDMRLNGGLGDIIATQKNILLSQESMSEFILPIAGNCGNEDLWIVTHKADSAVIYAYRITKDSLATTPVRSEYKKYESSLSLSPWADAVVSPDRSMVAFNFATGMGPTAKTQCILFHFDAETGRFSDALLIAKDEIEPKTFGGSAVAFSPDNKKLFREDAITWQYKALFQYDISRYDSTAINNSGILIDTFPGSSNFSTMRLYNDTIYYVSFEGTAVSTINNPNGTGADCGFQPDVIAVNSSTVDLPSEIVYPFYPDSAYALVTDTLICKGWTEGIRLASPLLKEGYQYTWSTGSMDTAILIEQAGTYWVETRKENCNYSVDTFIISGAELIKPEISINVHELSTPLPYDQYQWMLDGKIVEGATKSVYNADVNGDYQVIVANKYGCTDTSAIYKVTNASSIRKQTASFPITIYPNPADDVLFIKAPQPVDIQIYGIDGRLLHSENQTRKVATGNLANGLYQIKIWHNKQLMSTMKLNKTGK